MSKTQSITANQQFIDRWKGYAMQLQVKYGVPASVTLAQSLLESSRGRSNQAVNNNNFFGLRLPGGYIHFTNPEDSFYYYVRTVTGGSAFRGKTASLTAKSGSLAWINRICAAGYAEDDNYRPKIMGIIKSLGLEKYDQQAHQLAAREGKAEGYLRFSKKGADPSPYLGSGRSGAASTYNFDENSISALTDFTPDQLASMDTDKLMAALILSSSASQTPKYEKPLTVDGRSYCPPLPMSVMKVSSDMGQRDGRMHWGIDIPAPTGTDVRSTESGKVIEARPANDAGNLVRVEYDREDGTKYIVSYMHLSKINVQKGQEVSAGDVIGLAGNTGHSSGSHLHLEVWKGKISDKIDFNNHRYYTISPYEYIAELAVRTGKNWTCVKDGQDMCASFKDKMGLVGNGTNDNLQKLAALQVLANSGGMESYAKKLLEMGGDDAVKQSGSLLDAIFAMAIQSLGTMATLAMSSEMMDNLSGSESERAAVTPGMDNSLNTEKAAEAKKDMTATESAVYSENTEKQQQELNRDAKIV